MNVSSDSDSFPNNLEAGASGMKLNANEIDAVAKTKTNQPRLPSTPRPAQLKPKRKLDIAPSFEIEVFEELENQRLAQRLKRNKKSIGSMLASFTFHVLWIAVLLYLASPVEPGPKPISITATIESVPNDGPVESFTPAEIITKVVEPFESPKEDTQDSLDQAIEATAAEPVTIAVPTVAVEPVMPTTATKNSAVASNAAAPRVVGGGIEGRDADSRAAIAAARGGTPESEAAVEAGLRWIIEHQNYSADGGWSFQLACQKCRNSGSSESHNAATGLSLMALLGAGYTHREGPYQENVQRGLDSLIHFQNNRKSEFGGPFVDVTGAGMYTHAICTIAIAEAYAMTQDPALEESLVLAHQYILNAQHKKGGWRYRPNKPGDMLITGWQVMALKSLERCGISTPTDVYDRTIEFVESLEESNGTHYRYIESEPSSRAVPTAVGLLNQMYLQWPQDHPSLQDGAGLLVNRRVSKDDIYLNFYTTLLLHHLQHENWDYWNEAVRERLIKTQSTRGHEAGSWHFKHQHGDVGGRLYTTTLAVMTLEVYYRYSPLFGWKETPK